MMNGPQSVPTQSKEILDDPVNMQAWDIQISPTAAIPLLALPVQGSSLRGTAQWPQKALSGN